MVDIKIYKKYINKYLILIITGLFCIFCEAVCDLLQPTLMSRIIDDGIKNGSFNVILKHGITMLLITLTGMLFAGTRNVLASIVSQSFGADLRLDAFKKVLNFSEVSVDKLDSGSIITRMTNDISQVVQFANGMMRIFFKAPLTCIGAITLAVILSPRLSIIMFIGIGIVFIFIFISMKLSYQRFRQVQYAIDKVNTTIQEYLAGVRLVKAFGRFDYEEQKFDKANTDLSQKSIKSQLVIAYFSPLMTLSINICIVLIFYIGSLMFTSGTAKVGQIAAFISYMTQIMGSLIMITNIFNTFVRTKASAERVNEILDSDEETSKNISSKTSYFRSNQYQIEFDNVSFSYPGGSGISAIKNLSFKINQGETLAIIGSTGSGKSTITWLLLRFYEINSGNIYYNGNSIDCLDFHEFREQIAIAPQKSMLFSGSVKDNILWGNLNADEEEIQQAATMACADGFINEMSNGYNSILGQAGVNISGGQKQRISIARAIIKNAPVLILDDCTSALDAVTESKVRQNLKTRNGTVIMITQRVGTAMTADNILVMENGQMVGYGNHETLLSNCKIYQDIYNSQIGEV